MHEWRYNTDAITFYALPAAGWLPAPYRAASDHNTTMGTLTTLIRFGVDILSTFYLFNSYVEFNLVPIWIASVYFRPKRNQTMQIPDVTEPPMQDNHPSCRRPSCLGSILSKCGKRCHLICISSKIEWMSPGESYRPCTETYSTSWSDHM